MNKVDVNRAEQQTEEKCRIKLNKPIYMGASTLGLIKILIQDLYYQYTKNYCTELGGKAKMLLTDTNSLIYKIEAEFF